MTKTNLLYIKVKYLTHISRQLRKLRVKRPGLPTLRYQNGPKRNARQHTAPRNRSFVVIFLGPDTRQNERLLLSADPRMRRRRIVHQEQPKNKPDDAENPEEVKRKGPPAPKLQRAQPTGER